MRKILVIARSTILEMIRDRLFLVAFLLGFILIALSLVLGELTLAENQKIMADIGFSTVELAALVFVVFSGSFLIAKELEKQTILIVLARPVSRTQFLTGKFLGVIAVVTTLIVILSLLVLLLIGETKFFLPGLIPMWGLILEMFILTAFAIFWSNIIRPVLALSATILVFLTGHWLPDLKFFANRSGDPTFIAFGEIMSAVSPNFFRFNWKKYFILELPPPTAEIIWATAHAAIWTLLLICFASALFKKKDFV